jgi:hypothetical protein
MDKKGVDLDYLEGGAAWTTIEGIHEDTDTSVLLEATSAIVGKHNVVSLYLEEQLHSLTLALKLWEGDGVEELEGLDLRAAPDRTRTVVTLQRNMEDRHKITAYSHLHDRIEGDFIKVVTKQDTRKQKASTKVVATTAKPSQKPAVASQTQKSAVATQPTGQRGIQQFYSPASVASTAPSYRDKARGVATSAQSVATQQSEVTMKGADQLESMITRG